MKKRIIFVFVAIAIGLTSYGQTKEIKTALLVIDIQDFYFPGGDMPLYQVEKTAGNAAKLIRYFRENNNEVIYIRHNYKPGGNINKAVKPLADEKVFSKDNVNSFLGTGLEQYLNKLNIKKLVICGMQTHMCVEAAVRAAADMGYECVLIHDACTSRDLSYNGHTISATDVHLSTLSTLRSYAQIISIEEYLEKKP